MATRRQRGSISLPYHSSVVEEKERSSKKWTRPISLPIPAVRSRRFRICVPNFPHIRTRLRVALQLANRRRGPAAFCFACILFLVILCVKHFALRHGQHKFPIKVKKMPSTLVFQRSELQKIWKWEITSGHYPSRQPVPTQIGFTVSPANPALPEREGRFGSHSPTSPNRGVGPKRVYPTIRSEPPNVAYPPRPIPNSIADLDIVMKHCDFSQGKLVKDCLEVLRTGAGLDNGLRTRRGNIDDWKYIYTEQEDGFLPLEPVRMSPGKSAGSDSLANEGLVRRKGAEWHEPLSFPPVLVYHPTPPSHTTCDPEHPRLFHMFWAGPFTDKPYMTLLSYLYSQNTGVHVGKDETASSAVCRPKLWMWINPGPAASVPNPAAVHDMFSELKTNPWAAPFLHPRFKHTIEFKLWNTTEQLDDTPEWKDDWRSLDSLFTSDGHVMKIPKQVNGTASNNPAERTGSKSADSKDKLSTILSDLARFVLCHRFGGIYLDADNIMLRDWEELWGWKGAFAYRWSRIPKYNTAVLKLNKRSALGSFLFRTALMNRADVHPWTISRYTEDAYLNNLLLRLPDALFDPAWLNTEYYQRDRPPQPYFPSFTDFFDTPEMGTTTPQAVGFDGFFRGAYSYHYHNAWWTPFDVTRNYPDLGPRFIAGEHAVRSRAAQKALNESQSAKKKWNWWRKSTPKTKPKISPTKQLDEGDEIITIEDHVLAEEGEGDVESDQRHLDWSTVMKRTFEAYMRGEQPNMYGEWIKW